MPTIKIINEQYLPKIGTISKSRKPNATKSAIKEIMVGQDSYRDVYIETITEKGVQCFQSLSPNGMMDLVRALLQNVPDVTIAVDKRLQQIIKDAVDRSNADAKAVVDCVMERRNYDTQIKKDETK